MARLVKVIWAFSLVIFISGCASYRTASFPAATPGGAASRPDEIVISENANVRLTLNNGQAMSGEVVRISQDEIVLGKVGNYGFAETVIKASDIKTIEVESSSGDQETAMYVLMGVTALTITFGVALGRGLSHLGE